MMFIPRYCSDLNAWMKEGKVLVIYGPRQSGKTTLIKEYLKHTELKYRLVSGDNILLHELLGGNEFQTLIEFVQGFDLLVIDEAQKIKGIGNALKILADQVESLRVVVTGSSSFELAGQVGEPLTGRKRTLYLFPVSQSELVESVNAFDLKMRLEEFLIYGSYPEVLTEPDRMQKINLLEELTGSYLLKDILALEQVRSPKLLVDLLRLLAFQLGSEVSHSELARSLGVNYKTVTHYLDILEKTFVIYNLRGFSRNLRQEINRKSKYYFYDNGIRNTLISNFNSLSLRNDTGSLWENFLMMERVKFKYYKGWYGNLYFWRTWTQKEIDLVEERDGMLHAYEFKWKQQMSVPPAQFMEQYPGSGYQVIHPGNYLSFITDGVQQNP